MRARSTLSQIVRDTLVVGLLHVLALYLFFGTERPGTEPRLLVFWVATICSLYIGANTLGGLYRARPRSSPSPATRSLLSCATAVIAITVIVVTLQGSARVFPLRVIALAAILSSLTLLYLHSPRVRLHLAAVGLSVLVSLALAELFLSFVYDPLDLKRSVPGTPYELYGQILIEDPELGFRLKPGGHAVFERDVDFYQMEVQINSIGIRDREFAVDKPPGTIRILFAGDSIVFGAGIELEQTMVKMLEDGLNAQTLDGSRYEVMNWGVGSYCLSQELGLLERAEASKYRPDLLLLGTGPNDFGQSLDPNTFENQTGLLTTAEIQRSHGGLSGTGLRRSRFYRLVDFNLGRIRLSKPQSETLEAVASSPKALSTQKDLEQFRDYSNSLGIPLGVVLFPGEALLHPGDPGSDTQRLIYEVMQAQVTELGLPYLDCLPSLRDATDSSSERLFLAWDKIHYNARGNREITSQLIDFVRNKWFPLDSAVNQS